MLEINNIQLYNENIIYPLQSLMSKMIFYKDHKVLKINQIQKTLVNLQSYEKAKKCLRNFIKLLAVKAL